ncbi:MAG: LEA type 2 family protein [Gemmatimonadales bacterium]
MTRLASAGFVLTAACAALSTLGVVPLRFSEPPQPKPELRLLAPSTSRPLGGAAIRLWARVENQNRFGVTLSRVVGNLHVEDAEAIAGDFPLGLPLTANQDTIIPLDVSLRFDNLPRLARIARAALSGDPLDYRLEGSFDVDAGNLGSPRFGPLTLLTGQIQVR